MSVDVSTMEPPAPTSARRIALLFTPFIALVLGIGFVALWGLTAPDSRSPGDDGAINAILVLWMAAVVGVVAVAWTASSRLALRRAVAMATFALIAVAAWRVVRRMDAAWVDACQFGTSDHSRCVDGDASAPTWVIVAWLAVGVIAAVVGVAAAAIGRSASDA